MELTFPIWRDALALTESDGNPHAHGDAERAWGQFQMHPDFVDEYYPDGAVRVGMTWPEFFEACLLEFWRRHAPSLPMDEMGAIHLANRFHLGSTAYARGDRDVAYEARFRERLRLAAK